MGRPPEQIMKAYVAWKSQFAEAQKALVLANDAGSLRRLQQNLDLADANLHAWVLAHGGTTVARSAGEAVFEMPIGSLALLPKVFAQYGDSIESRVCAGVGTRLDEAMRALRLATLRGRAWVMHSDEVDAELQQESEMKKAEQVGFHRQNAAAAPAAPEAEASEHSQAEGLRSTLADAQEGAPPAPEQTHAAQDLEEQFHAEATSQGQKDEASQAQAGSADETAKAKQKLAQVLKVVQQQAPAIGQLKQDAPEAYAAVMGLVQGVIALARSVQPQPVQKSESRPFLAAFRHSSGEVVTTGVNHNTDLLPPEWEDATDGFIDDAGVFLTREEAKGRVLKKADDIDLTQPSANVWYHGSKTFEGPPRAMYLTPHRAVAEQFQGAVHGFRLAPDAVWHDIKDEYHSMNSVGYLPEAVARHQARGRDVLWSSTDHGGGSQIYVVNPTKLIPHTDSDLEKAQLPMPQKTHRVNLHLPAGSTMTGGPGAARHRVGRMKVKHGDGRTTWVSVRAGMVTAVADRHASPVLGTASHPISSRNPAAR